MYECKRCEKKFEKYDSLRKHVGRVHKVPSIDFYVEFNLGGKWPLCKCGCGEKVKWSPLLKGFCDFCQGHQSRVYNNWGNNPTALARSLETRKERFKKGEITTWNSGLTAESDVRVAKYGKGVSESFTAERRKEYRDRFTHLREIGKIVPLRGPDHSQWKGGVSEINILARTDKRLYDEWKYPILVRDGFKCVECGTSNGKLHIHHDKELMYEIVQKHMPDEEDIVDFELKKSIASKIVDYHIKQKVSGITLCEKCHNKLHPSLNF